MVFCAVDYLTTMKKNSVQVYVYTKQLEATEDLLSAHSVTYFVKTLKYHYVKRNVL